MKYRIIEGILYLCTFAQASAVVLRQTTSPDDTPTYTPAELEAINQQYNKWLEQGPDAGPDAVDLAYEASFNDDPDSTSASTMKKKGKDYGIKNYKHFISCVNVGNVPDDKKDSWNDVMRFQIRNGKLCKAGSYDLHSRKTIPYFSNGYLEEHWNVSESKMVSDSLDVYFANEWDTIDWNSGDITETSNRDQHDNFVLPVCYQPNEPQLRDYNDWNARKSYGLFNLFNYETEYPRAPCSCGDRSLDTRKFMDALGWGYEQAAMTAKKPAKVLQDYILRLSPKVLMFYPPYERFLAFCELGIRFPLHNDHCHDSMKGEDCKTVGDRGLMRPYYWFDWTKGPHPLCAAVREEVDAKSHDMQSANVEFCTNGNNADAVAVRGAEEQRLFRFQPYRTYQYLGPHQRLCNMWSSILMAQNATEFPPEFEYKEFPVRWDWKHFDIHAPFCDNKEVCAYNIP